MNPTVRDRSPRPPRWSRTILASLLVFVAASGLHALLRAQYRSDPFSTTYVSDALSYEVWADRIARDGIGAEPVFHQSPLFPMTLAAVYDQASPAQRRGRALTLQGALTALALALLVPLGRSLFGSHGAGVAAGVVGILYGPILFHGLKLLPVPLALATQAAALLALVLARERRRPGPALAAGALWGLACLARAEMLLFLPVALAALWSVTPNASRPRRFALLAGMFVAGAAAVVAPATLHNLAHGDRVLIASAGGENLFAGNRLGAEGGHTALSRRAGDLFSQREEARRIAEQAEGRELRPSQVSSYWVRRALADVATAPGGWLRLELLKLGRVLDPGDPTDMYSYPLERNRYLRAMYLLPLSTAALWILAVAGVAVAWRRTLPTMWPLSALVAVHCAVLLAFFVSTRLRLPLLFFLVPFAGHAVWHGGRAWRDGGRPRRLAGAIGVLVAVACVAEPLYLHASSREVVRLASVLSTQGRLDESLATLAPLIDAEPADSFALDQAGWVWFKKGDFLRAREMYLRALEAGLDDVREVQLRTRLAWVYERLGELDEAERQHDLAASAEEADAGAVYERGMFLVRLAGSARIDGPERRVLLARARRDFERAVQLSPDWSAPREALRSIGRPVP